MMHKSKLMLARKLLAVFVVGMLPAAAWAAAGKVIFVSGDVAILDKAGTSKVAAIGSPLEPGESVVTKLGRAQIRFTDGGMISLVPNTEFRVDEYSFSGKEDGREKSFFSLVKGGLRAITGAVGHQNKAAYKMETSVATIGIRGTEFQAVMCQSNCAEPDGLYVHTGEGKIFVRNAFGEIDLAVGQSGYVASPNAAPQRTSAAPRVSAAPPATTPPPIPGVGKDPVYQFDQAVTATEFAIVPFTGNGLGIGLAGSGPITFGTVSGVMDGAGAAGGPNNLSVPLSPTFLAGTGVGFYMNGNAVMGIAFWNNGQFANLRFGAAQNVGADGSLYWGRWTNTTMTAGYALNTYSQVSGSGSATTNISPNTSIHYLLGTSVPTIPVSGTVNYGFIGGTPSTDPSGFVGQGVTSGTLTAYFSSNAVGANFMVAHDVAYNVSAYMPMKPSNRVEFSSAQPGGTVAVNGSYSVGSKVEGFFAGTNSAAGNPTQAGVSYRIDRPAGGVVGVAAFKCSGC